MKVKPRVVVFFIRGVLFEQSFDRQLT